MINYKYVELNKVRDKIKLDCLCSNGCFMFAKKLSIVTYCFAVLLHTSAYASSSSISKHLVQIIPTGDYSSPSFTEPMGKATLVYPKRISPQKFQEITELYIMHPSAFDSFIQSLKTTIPHEESHDYGERMELTHLVTTMIEKLGDTITAAKDLSKNITSLPDLNKYLLHEVARALKNKNLEYNTLFISTQELSEKYKQYKLDLSMKRINYAYQLGTEYSQYLDLDHIISLATVWLVGYILEQKGETPIVTSESVISIMPSIIEAEKLAHGESTDLYRLLTQLDEKFGAAE